ncbi:chitinase domain-containing protein 1 [Ananas comosus]|uniref:Chitinase domain-containing protein 1 n=1 Tax=Ananas comosus TaxID=4615 RepID=A0A199W8F3_ANACO|nr:chitinase domain-containing protein 1 [Ananas comosus]OAY85599.1 Chitinase domain-containing protein 1 [Ananas comosus]
MPTRRRDRRNPPGPSEPASPNRPAQTPPPAASKPRLLLVFFFFLLLLLLVFVSLLAVHRSNRGSPNAGAPALSVYERGLVKADVAFREILAENARVSENRSRRHFPNPVLAYVTPWNSKGYEMAKLFTSKFTHLSPVWYDLKSEGKNLVLEGRHNADVGWISELRKNGNSLVVPRVVLEAFPVEILLKKKRWSKAINLIVDECKEMGYDGIVLESWSRWAVYGVLNDPELRNLGLQFINQLGEALHSVNSKSNLNHQLELIYVIPPSHSEKLSYHDFGPQDLQQLGTAVDGFSLMTYDFSGPQNPGPNAPLKWIRASLEMLLGGADSEHAPKIFLGINFYGNDFVLSGGGGAITGRDYISLLEKHKPKLQWEEKSSEHFFVYSLNNVKHAVFYPSLMSISLRLDEARAWGAGLSIWEIGQGLDYFFDLL